MSMLNMLLASGGKTFNAIWSGDSLVDISFLGGIKTSGSSFRAYFYSDIHSAPWSSVGLDGNFTANSVTSAGAFIPSSGYIISGNLIKSTFRTSNATTWITFNLATTAFSGSSVVNFSDGESSMTYGLVTSGGLIAGNNDGTISSYISLK